MGRICLHFLIVVMINYHLSASDVSPNYYCADMNPQPHVDIDQVTKCCFRVKKKLKFNQFVLKEIN